jgi:hypothetical protein
MAYIAYQQYRTNKLKLKFDLYEKRLKIYQALMDFISFVISFPEMNPEEVRKLDIARAESFFLFGEDIVQYLACVRDKAAQITALNSQIEELASPDRNPERTLLVNQKLQLIEWFYQQVDASKTKFSKYFSFPR